MATSTPSKVAKPTPITVAQASGDGLELELLANRGVRVWPDGSPETLCTDDFRCRFTASAKTATPKQINDLIARINGLGLEVAMVINLHNYDGKAGFTLAQGQ